MPEAKHVIHHGAFNGVTGSCQELYLTDEYSELDGQVVWAVERVPGGVVGDGESTIEQLVQRENTTALRRAGPEQTLKPLALDAEAQAQLAKQSLRLSDLPTAGRFVRLSSIANVATGGRPVPVMEHVHPDNKALAERAARALRLDIAGVDLLIPDIGQSWRNGGAAICEVNAQPDLGATTALHLYGEVLTARVAGEGRIPVIAVVGGERASRFIQRCVQEIKSTRRIGWMTHQAIGIGITTLQRGKFKSFSGAQILLTDACVEAVLFQIAADDAVRTGLPVDQLDAAIIVEPLTPVQLQQELEKSLRPASQQPVLMAEDVASEDNAVTTLAALLK